MNQEWKQFLHTHGAEFAEEHIAHFGTFERERRLVCAGTVIAALTQQVVVRISGNDAEDFLHNQLTNDIRQVSDNQAQLNAWCTHQGKVLASLLLCKQEDSYRALLAADLASNTLQRLKMFVLHADVQIHIDHDLVVMEVAGPNALEDLELAGLPCPQHTFEQASQDNALFIAMPGLSPRVRIIGPREAMEQIWQRLDVRCAPVGENAWRLFDIRAGLPHIQADNTELFTPHMLNMQEIPMVDFQKGCYPGQEVVARMQYLGKNKRKMYHITIEQSQAIAAGEKLLSESSSSQKGAGQIVQTALNGDGTIEGLAVLDQTAVDHDDLTDANGNRVGFMECSYS